MSQRGAWSVWRWTPWCVEVKGGGGGWRVKGEGGGGSAAVALIQTAGVRLIFQHSSMPEASQRISRQTGV